MEDLKWLVRKWGIPLLILLGVLIYGVCILGQTEQENKKEAEKNSESQKDVFVSDVEKQEWGEQEDNSDYELKNIEIKSEEREEILEKLQLVAEKCKPIYIQADKGEASNIVLEEEDVHQMIECIAEAGYPIGCGGDDYNMQNYESVHDKLIQAKKGYDTETEFYVINSSAIISYNNLQFVDGNLFVTYGSVTFNDNMDVVITYMEKIEVYKWEYTEKGWMIWEKALSRNQEMDMHVFHRILPLEGRCREFGSKCIIPISYFCNNLFLTDWDDDSMQKVEFNDLFEFLYTMDTGMWFDSDKYLDGILKEEFEILIQKYFDISSEDLRRYAGYDEHTGTYPWSAIGYWNRIQQFQSFPEVVKCVENEDGTISIYVDAVFREWGNDCSFSHIVTIREKDDGTWIYCGNKVDWENAFSVPDYKPRRDYIESN